jgi:cyclic pyranopterin phosphate synthase
MPSEGMQWLPREEVLTFEEIERVTSVCVERFGFDSVRLTGGEPTVRAHLPVLIDKLARPGLDLSMTTNGATLAASATDLFEAGLGRLNISCDSLRRDRFEELTRRDELPSVLAGIDAAVESGLDPVKVNVVVMRGINDDEVVDFARFGRERGAVVRFIEFMPLDADERWNRSLVVPRDEIVDAIDALLPLEPVGRDHQPAERYRYRDGGGEVGVIPSVTDAFCDSCDRVRLTAEGGLRNCLFALEETDLRAIMRAGGTDDDLATAISDTVGAKWAGHAIGQVHFIRPSKSMSQIGG